MSTGPLPAQAGDAYGVTNGLCMGFVANHNRKLAPGTSSLDNSLLQPQLCTVALLIQAAVSQALAKAWVYADALATIFAIIFVIMDEVPKQILSSTSTCITNLSL